MLRRRLRRCRPTFSGRNDVCVCVCVYGKEVICGCEGYDIDDKRNASIGTSESEQAASTRNKPIPYRVTRRRRRRRRPRNRRRALDQKYRIHIRLLQTTLTPQCHVGMRCCAQRTTLRPLRECRPVESH